MAFTPATEAVEEMAAEGYPVAALVPAVINPLPADRIISFANQPKAVIVPEVNRTGQFAAWVKAYTELRLISLNKYGGLPFTPQEIRSKVMEFLVAPPPEPTPGPEPVEEVSHG